MPKPMPMAMPMADDEMAEGEAAAPEGDRLAQVEASAWADIKAAIASDDDASGIAALRDFVTACVKREMAGEYAKKG